MFPAVPTSYKDPYWTKVAMNAEEKVGIPKGLLTAVFTRGEKTNADRVSSAGAKTPFQIIPSTRDLFLKKYGVDAYLSPENAAEVAALHLKESLDRNKGNTNLAVAEYHGGSDRKNWGPITKAYVQRVGYTPEAATTETAQPQEQSSEYTPEQLSTLKQVYESGGMDSDPAAKAEYEAFIGVKPTPAPENNQDTGSYTPDELATLQQAYDSGVMDSDPQAKADYEAFVGIKPEPTTTPAGVAGAMTRGLAPVAAGAAMGALAGSVIPAVGTVAGGIAGAGAASLSQLASPIIGSVNSMLGTNFADPQQAMEALLTKVGVAEPRTQAEKIIQTTASGAGGAIGGVALGNAVQSAAQAAGKPVAEAVGRTLAAAPVQQVIGGATGGAASQSAAEMGASAPVQALAGLAGNVIGGMGKGSIQTTPVADDIARSRQGLVQSADDAGIKLMTSDVLPPKTFAGKSAQMIGERIPLAGTGGLRTAQQTQRVDAIKNVLKEYGATDLADASEAVMKDLARKHSADVTKYVNLKNEVFKNVAGKGFVPVPNATAKIDEQLKYLDSLKSEAYTPIKRVLTDWKQSIRGQNIDNIEALRKQLGESFSAPELSSIRTTGEKIASSIYAPLKQDMENFIAKYGDKRDVTKWKVANARLADGIEEMQKTGLGSVLKKGDMTPEAVDKLLFSNKRSDVALLYRKLTPEGRAHARSAIISKVANNITNGDAISPEKFVSQVKKNANSIGVMFNQDQLRQVQGLAKVLEYTKRASETGLLPPTGVQNFYTMFAPAAMGAGVGATAGTVAGVVAPIATGATLGGIARVYESPAVRNILMRMPSVKVGSEEEAMLVKRLMNIMQQKYEEK